MMRLLVLCLVAAMAAPATAAAQGTLDPEILDAACRANTTTADDLDTCLQVVHEFLVPGSGTATVPTGLTADAAAADRLVQRERR